jgi:hypothetical protein
MSETGIENFPSGNESAHGQVRQPEQMLEPLVQFSKEQPVATAICALILGYILGKLF